MGLEEIMQWAESSVWLDLREDGDEAVVVFNQEPRLIITKGNFGPRERAVFPVVTKQGLKCFGVNRRTAKLIAGKWSAIKGVAIKVMRVGGAGSTNVSYRLYRADQDAALIDLASKVTAADYEALMNNAKQGIATVIDEDADTGQIV